MSLKTASLRSEILSTPPKPCAFCNWNFDGLLKFQWELWEMDKFRFQISAKVEILKIQYLSVTLSVWRETKCVQQVFRYSNWMQSVTQLDVNMWQLSKAQTSVNVVRVFRDNALCASSQPKRTTTSDLMTQHFLIWIINNVWPLRGPKFPNS